MLELQDEEFLKRYPIIYNISSEIETIFYSELLMS